MAWYQKSFHLPAYKRGFHLITELIEEQYLCEHRNHASGRQITVTIQGE